MSTCNSKIFTDLYIGKMAIQKAVKIFDMNYNAILQSKDPDFLLDPCHTCACVLWECQQMTHMNALSLSTP